MSRLTLCFIKIDNLKLCTTGVEVWLHSFLTSALDRDEWLTSCPGLSAPLNRAPEPIWTSGEEKNMLPLPGFEPRTAQSVGSRCIDYVTPVSVGHRKHCELLFSLFLVLRAGVEHERVSGRNE